MERLSRITPNQVNNSRTSRYNARISRFRNLFYKVSNGIKRVGKALPDIIFPYNGSEPGYILGAMGGPGPIGPKLTPEQIAKVDLLESFFALSVQCLSGDIGEEILACDVLEKFGNRLSDTKKSEIEDFKQAEEDLDLAATHPFSDHLERLPLEKIEALVDLAIEDKNSILNKVRELMPEVREYLLHRFSVFLMICGGIPHEHVGKIREKILAYYIYTNKIPDLLNSSNLENHRKTELGIEIVNILIRFGLNERAIKLLYHLLNKASPRDCAFIYAQTPFKQNLLLKMLDLLKKLIPEMYTEKGLSLIIRRYKELGSSSKEDHLIVNAGLIYPQHIVEKVSRSVSPLVKSLLSLGQTILKMHQNNEAALSIFIDFLKEIRGQNLVIQNNIIDELNQRIRGKDLIPDSVLDELLARGDFDIDDFSKWESESVWPALPTDTEEDTLIFGDREEDTLILENGIDPIALDLRDRVRQSGQLLLFTRNIKLKELEDIVNTDRLRISGARVNYFRYGLGHEYGEKGGVICVVMKKSFLELEKKRSNKLRSLLLTEINGKDIPGTKFRNGEIKGQKQKEKILRELAELVDYNRNLSLMPSFDSWESEKSLAGMTIERSARDKYMGMYPQLEVSHNISLDQVEKILVPEHMYEEVCRKAKKNRRVFNLIQKVEGTGKNKGEFLQGREELGRRSRASGGQFNPNFGFDSFFRFEQAYFKLVLGEPSPAKGFASKALALMERYGYQGTPNSWIVGDPKSVPRISREKYDWKIFVNPRKRKFFKVLEEVLKVLSIHKNLGIPFKIPSGLSLKWRAGRKFGSASNAPKITIWVNEETLPLILYALDKALEKSLANAGFGRKPGPSFTRNYGSTDLLFYKKEYRYDLTGDERVGIANLAEEEARNAGITDEDEIWQEKQYALHMAGYSGENFYIQARDSDPVLGEIVE